MNIKYTKLNDLDFNAMTVSIFFSSIAILLVFYFVKSDLNVTSFERIMGNSLMHGIDVEKRINLAYFIYILTPIIFFIVFYLFSLIYKKNKDEKECLNFLKIISIISLTCVFFFLTNLINNLFKSKVLLISILFSFIICTLLILYLLVLKRFISFKAYKWSLYIFFEFTFVCILISNMSIKRAMIYCLIFFIAWIFISFLNKGFLLQNFKRLTMSFIPFMNGLFIISLFLECCNILNQYNIIIKNKDKISILIYFILIILSILTFFILKVKNINVEKDYEKYYHIALILSLGFISALLPLQTIIHTDLFESANHGMMINDFLKYGKIPIIETFDAHMLSNSFLGIIYGLLNKDNFGAIFALYNSYLVPIFLTIIYYIVSKFFDRDFAFFMVLLFPYNTPYFYLDFSLITILGVIYCIKKNNYHGFFIYSISVFTSILYRLDFGFSFGVASLFALLVTNKVYSLNLKLKKLFIAIASSIFISLSFFVIICFIKNINPILRLNEIYFLLKSNTNWAYSTIGDTSKFGFILTYIIIPILILFILSSILINIWKKNIIVKMDNFIIIFILILVFIVNMPRGLVRHSFAESTLFFFASSAILVFAFYLSLYFKSYDKLAFIGVLTFSSLLIPVFMTNSNYNSSNLIDNSLSKYYDPSSFSTASSQKVDRVLISNGMKELTSPILMVMDRIMNEDETYVDFTNQTLLYALSDKKKPVYVNQSPALLSGEFMQEEFIDQLINSDKEVTFALMPSENQDFNLSLDGIQNSYRYYKVSEFISKNYIPICLCDSFSIWCKNDRYDLVIDRIKDSSKYTNISSNKANIDTEEDGIATCFSDIKTFKQIKDSDYGNLEALHFYSLEKIPYIWGMHDEKKSYLNKEIKDSIIKYDDYYSIDTININKDKGNYILMEGDFNDDENCNITFYEKNHEEFIPLSNFSFSINKGEKQRYLIRVSSDFYWYLKKINAFKISDNLKCNNLKIKLLEGD